MMFKFIPKEKINNLPAISGVYAFFATPELRRSGGGLLYIGKAVDIRERVKNHFNQPTFKDNVFIPQTEKIGYIATGSEIEALILEAELIKKFQPKFNTQWKDNKNYWFAAITKEEWPRVFITHQLQTTNYKLLTNMGPFVDGKALKQTLRVLRRVFPYRTCRILPKKSCLYEELKLCPAPCQTNLKSQISNFKSTSQISNLRKEYKKNIKNLIAILQGRKTRVLKNLQKEMNIASQRQNFEQAKTLRDQVWALENVFSHSHILKTSDQTTNLQGAKLPASYREFSSLLGIKIKIKRIEGYDISNIQGQQATGSMVVFENGQPNKNEYRKFHIKIEGESNDTAMLQEMISRRLKHSEWPMPQVMLIDGGKAQLGAALQLKIQSAKFKVMALAKRKNELFIEGQKKPVLLKNLPQEIANLTLRIRDEAHRFAIAYHKKLRSKSFLG